MPGPWPAGVPLWLEGSVEGVWPGSASHDLTSVGSRKQLLGRWGAALECEVSKKCCRFSQCLSRSVVRPGVWSIRDTPWGAIPAGSYGSVLLARPSQGWLCALSLLGGSSGDPSLPSHLHDGAESQACYAEEYML